MDVQIAFPLIYPLNITIYQSDDIYYTGYGLDSHLGWFQDWLDAIDGVCSGSDIYICCAMLLTACLKVLLYIFCLR
jgi:hypothetical protein